MKKIIFLIIFAGFVIESSMAQIFQNPAPVLKQSTITKTAPPPPPTSTQKTTGAASQFVPIYTLTAARVNIRTGSDNKEFPSGVWARLYLRSVPMGMYSSFFQGSLKNEMRVNSNTEFGLEKTSYENMKDITLNIIEEKGLTLRVAYKANIGLDAWKIENISLSLEFRDQNNNLHPTFSPKTISFSNANGFLNGFKGTTDMVCTIDRYLNPLSANIE